MSEPSSDTLRTENAVGNAFTDRTRAIVVTLAVISLLATLGSIVFGRSLTSPPALPRDSYGRGPLGHRAWAETMQALGLHVVRWTRPRYEDVSAPLFFIEPDHAEITAPDGTTTSLGEICRTRSEQGRITVIVLPKWVIGMFGQAGPELPSNVYDALEGTPFEGTQVVWQPHITGTRESITASSPMLGERHLEIPWPQTVIGPTPILSGPTGTFIASDESGRVFLVSDPDLLHNFDVQRGDHAAITHEMITEILHADTIVIDEVFHEHVETRSLGAIFAHFPGILALIHGTIVILVVLFYGRRRFGPPRQTPAPYGRGPREVIEVAAGVLASGQAVERLAPRYVEQVILDAHRRLGLSEGKSIAQKAAALDVILVRRNLAPDAVRLLETSQSATRETALSYATRATQLRASLLGTSKKTPPRERPVSIPPPPPPTSPTASPP